MYNFLCLGPQANSVNSVVFSALPSIYPPFWPLPPLAGNFDMLLCWNNFIIYLFFYYAFCAFVTPATRQQTDYAVVGGGRGEEGDERIFRNWTLVSPFSSVSLSPFLLPFVCSISWHWWQHQVTFWNFLLLFSFAPFAFFFSFSHYFLWDTIVPNTGVDFTIYKRCVDE